jgi:hypothetical protein
MRFRGTAILLVVCLAFGTFLYFYEIKGGEEREKEKKSENLVWKIDPKDIKQIETSSDGQTITAIRNGEAGWQLTSPRSLIADPDELNRVANLASEIRRESVVDQNAADLSGYGLNPVQVGLKVVGKDGKEHAINFGNNNPAGNSTYAVLPGKKEVFLVAAATASSFKKKLDDLRNHNVLNFEQPEVNSIHLKSEKGEINLIKDSNDQWWFTGKDKIAADSAGVRGILNAISLAKIKEFVGQDQESMKNALLKNPAIEITLLFGKNEANKHLTIGQVKSDSVKKPEEIAAANYIAKDGSRPELFYVERDLIDKVSKSPKEMRDRALATFQRWDVDSISITNTKGNISFIKSSGEWLLAATKKKAKWELINSILDAMEKPVRDWIDKPAALASYGLDKPLIHVIMKKGAVVVVDCSLGKSAKDGIYAQVQDDPSVKIANPDGISSLDKAEADYVDSEAPATPAKEKK